MEEKKVEGIYSIGCHHCHRLRFVVVCCDIMCYRFVDTPLFHSPHQFVGCPSSGDNNPHSASFPSFLSSSTRYMPVPGNPQVLSTHTAHLFYHYNHLAGIRELYYTLNQGRRNKSFNTRRTHCNRWWFHLIYTLFLHVPILFTENRSLLYSVQYSSGCSWELDRPCSTLSGIVSGQGNATNSLGIRICWWAIQKVVMTALVGK